MKIHMLLTIHNILWATDMITVTSSEMDMVIMKTCLHMVSLSTTMSQSPSIQAMVGMTMGTLITENQLTIKVTMIMMIFLMAMSRTVATGSKLTTSTNGTQSGNKQTTKKESKQRQS